MRTNETFLKLGRLPQLVTSSLSGVGWSLALVICSWRRMPLVFLFLPLPGTDVLSVGSNFTAATFPSFITFATCFPFPFTTSLFNFTTTFHATGVSSTSSKFSSLLGIMNLSDFWIVRTWESHQPLMSEHPFWIGHLSHHHTQWVTQHGTHTPSFWWSKRINEVCYKFLISNPMKWCPT